VIAEEDRKFLGEGSRGENACARARFIGNHRKEERRSHRWSCWMITPLPLSLLKRTPGPLLGIANKN